MDGIDAMVLSEIEDESELITIDPSGTEDVDGPGAIGASTSGSAVAVTPEAMDIEASDDAGKAVKILSVVGRGSDSVSVAVVYVLILVASWVIMSVACWDSAAIFETVEVTLMAVLS